MLAGKFDKEWSRFKNGDVQALEAIYSRALPLPGIKTVKSIYEIFD